MYKPSGSCVISTHAPLAGRDLRPARLLLWISHFNPRAPCGARPFASRAICPSWNYFNPRAPCGARRGPKRGKRLRKSFQPTRPLRGATAGWCNGSTPVSISTHAPLAGRDCYHRAYLCIFLISTHAPLAGRDSKSVQITMHIFAITDKFQMLLHRMPPVRAFCSFLMQENHADFGCEPPK